jgi:putative intracellular protease/amidase
LVIQAEVIGFIKAVADSGGVVGAIGGGALPLISAGVLDGKTVTGNRLSPCV